MAASKSKSKSKSKSNGKASGRTNGNGRGKADAETLLKADHRKVEGLFKKFERAESDSEKEQLAKQICLELIIHTKLEEEIFYPACREAEVEDDLMNEAQVEHDGAKVLVNELMEGSPSDEFYDAKMTVLSEYIKHHVGEEEQTGKGIFAKAKKAGVDMEAVGEQIKARKAELMEEQDELTSEPPQAVALEHLADVARA